MVTMRKFISDETIKIVKQVTVYEVATALGFHMHRRGAHWQFECPNPSHDTHECYLGINKGIFKCFGGGGCGAGGDAISFYGWHHIEKYDAKKHFAKSVEGVAQLMGIPIEYTDGTILCNEEKPSYVPMPQEEYVEVLPADPEVCNRTYRRFLELCPIYEEHLQEWLGAKRQYTEKQVEVIGLRSVPRSFEEAKNIVTTLFNEGYQLERVPGFTQFLKKNGDPEKDSDWYWLLAGMGQYYIPVRDEYGRIIRLRIKTNNPVKKKYVWFSSEPMITERIKRRGGAPSGAPLNVVVPTRYMSTWGSLVTDLKTFNKAIIIEGEHKAYICSEILDTLIIGVPGSGNFRDVIPLLKKLGVTEVYVAYDIDAFYDEEKETQKNEYVHEHLRKFIIDLLSESSMNVYLLVWNHLHGKGLDDLLLQTKKLPMAINVRTNEEKPYVI